MHSLAHKYHDRIVLKGGEGRPLWLERREAIRRQQLNQRANPEVRRQRSPNTAAWDYFPLRL